MSDADLPIFSFRANWREPMAERIAFLTDVMAATEGAEQRRSVRQTPRRTYEADFLLTGRERTFWDLFMNSLGGGDMLAPLYWEVVTLADPLEEDVSDRIDFDTSFREWTYHTGRYALLTGRTALDYELVEVSSVDAGGITLAVPVTRNWPKGTKMYPMRRAVLDQVSEVRQPTAAVGVTTAQIRVVGPNPWVPAADLSPVYAGLPVMLEEPNWVDDLTASFDRDIDLVDLNVGLTYQVDATGRALLGQAHRWFLTGRERLAGFRDLIYRHRGRAGTFWLPTFKADLRLVASAGAGATQITVENVGYRYTGGPTSGREYIAIKHSGGTIFRRVLSVIAGTTLGTERVNLDAPLGLALSPGQVRRISFMDTARFDTDEFEIVHHGGVDAHHDASAMFRTFKNTRSAPTPIHLPIPVGAMTDGACGQFPAHLFWRVRFLENATDRFRLRNMNFVDFRDPDDPGQPCGNLFQCRDVIGPSVLFDSQRVGFLATDLFIFIVFELDWCSVVGAETAFVGFNFGNRFYDPGPFPAFRLELTASESTGAERTSITRFEIQFSDDAENWTTTRIVTTNGAWAPKEKREWSVY